MGVMADRTLGSRTFGYWVRFSQPVNRSVRYAM